MEGELSFNCGIGWTSGTTASTCTSQAPYKEGGRRFTSLPFIVQCFGTSYGTYSYRRASKMLLGARRQRAVSISRSALRSVVDAYRDYPCNFKRVCLLSPSHLTG